MFCRLAVIYILSGTCLSAIVLASYPHLTPTNVLMLLVIMIAIDFTAMLSKAGALIAAHREDVARFFRCPARPDAAPRGWTLPDAA